MKWKIKKYNDFLLEIITFDEVKDFPKRNLLQHIISMLKNNNALYLVFCINGFSTVFTRVVLLILCSTFFSSQNSNYIFL